MDYNTILFATITITVNVKNIQLYDKIKVIDDFTEKVGEYDWKTFGSDIYFELNINKLDFIDYIMLPKGGNGSSKIALNNIMLQNGEYLLEIEVSKIW